MAVNCAILSYNGTVYFGFSGDTHAAPDLRRLETLLQESFVELRAALGIASTQKKRRTGKRRAVLTVATSSRITTSLNVPIPIAQPESQVMAADIPPDQSEKALMERAVAYS
jgi:hypothetical protein